MTETVDTANVKPYNRAKLTVSLIGGIVSFLFTAAILFFGITLSIEHFAFSYSANPYIALLTFSALFGLLSSIVTLPFSFFSGFVLEHR